MKRVKVLKSLSATLVLLLLCNLNVVSQDRKVLKFLRETSSSGSTLKGSTSLKGAMATIASLDAEYCSEDGKIVISAPANAMADSINWRIVGWDGSTPVEYTTTWGQRLGNGNSATYELDLDNVPSNYYNTDPDPDAGGAQKIYVEYQYFRNLLALGAAVVDYTSVYLKPTEFTLSGGASICDGITTDLILSDSEENITYYLLDNGIDTGTSLPGDGGALVFTVTSTGKYTVVARNTLHNICETDMSGEIDVVVNPVPVVTIDFQAPAPVNICAGDEVVLEVGGSGAEEFTFYLNSVDPANILQGPGASNEYRSSALNNGDEVIVVGVDTDFPTGCSASASITLNINPLPVATPTFDQVCNGGTLQLHTNPTSGSGTYTTFAWTGPDTYSANTSDPQRLTVDKALHDGNYTVVVTDDIGCVSVPASVNVVIDELPTPTINGDATVTTTEYCEGDNIVLTGGGGPTGSTYTWTVPGGGTVVGQTLTINNSVSGTDDGVYTLELDNGTCTNTLTHNVVIRSNPNVTLDSDPASAVFCSGTNVLFTAGGADEYAFYLGSIAPANELQARSAVNTYNTSALNHGDIVIVQGFDTSNAPVTDCSATAQITVTVYELPVVTPTFDATCDGDDLNLHANPTLGAGGYTFSWTHPTNGFTSADQDPVIVGADKATYDGVYTVQVTDANTCQGTNIVTVTINNLPTPQINGDAAITTTEVCEGSGFTLTASGGTTYTWNLPGGGTFNGAVYTVVASDQATHQGLYTVTVNDGTCDNTLDHNVVVNTLPTPTAGNNGPLCVGNQLELTGGPAAMASYSWTGPNSYTSTTQSPIVSATVSTAMAGTYTLEVSDGKCTNTVTTVVVVNDVASSISVSAPAPGVTTVCAGTSVTFNGSGASGSGNYTYEFRRVRGGSDNIVQAAGASTTYVATGADAPQDGDQFYVVVNDVTTTCSDSSTPITINVISNPVPTLTITNNGGSSIICDGEQLDFSAAPIGFARYVFRVNGTSVQDGASNTFSYSAFANNDIVQVTAYTDLTPGACFGTSSDITVQVNTRPTPVINGDKTVCVNATKPYSADVSGLGKGNYTWAIQGGTLSPTSALDEESIEVVWDQPAPHSISLNYVNAAGCSAVNPMLEAITVNTVTAGLTADKTDICSDEDVTFTATGGATYVFIIDGIDQPIGADPTSGTFVASGLTNGQVVSVRAIDAIGCNDTHAGITINVNTKPTPTITSGPATVCEGTTATYETQGGFINYVWTVSAGGTINGPNNLSTVNVDWKTAGAQSIKVQYESVSGGCVGDEFNLPVTVNAIPTGTSLNASPSQNVIKGTDISLTASGGVEYAFFKRNGGSTELQGRGVSNTLLVSTEAPGANPVLVHGDTIRTYIYNAAGCSVYEEIIVGVYDGINPFNVIASEPGHCFGESITSISLSGFQAGITYELFRIGTPDASLGKILATAGIGTVKWDNIKGANPAAQFKVVAYYNGTPPTPAVDMSNTVLVEEYVQLINTHKVSPSVDQKCGDVINVSLDNSDAGVDYQLLNGSTVVATEKSTGGVLTFSNVTLSVGTYTVKATKDNGGIVCTALMSGSFNVTGDPSVITYNIEGTKEGKFCDDGSDAVAITLSGSQNTYTYELLFNNASLPTPVTRTSTADGEVLNFGTYTDEGDYSVILKHAGCTYYMDTVVTVERVAMPGIFNIGLVGGGHYCANDADGVELTISISEPSISYQLLLDGNPVKGAVITGGVTTFGKHTAEGTYSVVATTGVPSICNRNSGNSVDVKKDALPIKQTVLFDGDFCQGQPTFLHIDKSEVGVEYYWYNTDDNSQQVTPIPGTGGKLDFRIIASGHYDIRARNINGANCVEVMNDAPIEIKEKPLPDNTLNVIISTQGTGCTAGDVVTIQGSEDKVTYTLVKKVGSDYHKVNDPAYTITSTGGDLNFPAIVDQAFSYTALAELDGCTTYLLDDALVDVPDAIARQTLTSTLAEKCNGEPEKPTFSLLGSETGVTYQLWHVKGSGTDSKVGAPVSGTTGSPLILGESDKEGTYYVKATSVSCTAGVEMDNRVPFNINDLPIAFNMTGSGKYCDPVVGATIGLDNTQDGVKYQLQYYTGGVLENIGDPITAGPTTGAIVFKNSDGSNFIEKPETGFYRVVAISPKTCTSSMKGNVQVQQVASVVNFNVVGTSPFIYCANGGTGVEIVLEDQEDGTIYELVKIEDDLTETHINTQTGGVSGQLTMGTNILAGTYAIYGYYPGSGDVCKFKLNNGDNIIVLSDPAKPVADNTEPKYCFGGDGAVITVNTTQVGIDYYIVNNATSEREDWLTGTGNSESFSNKVSKGSYYIMAKSFASGCEDRSLDITVSEYDEIEIFKITVGQPNSNAGMNVIDAGSRGNGNINVDSIGLAPVSTTTVLYTLYKDDIAYPGYSQFGTGNSFVFDDAISDAGIYTIKAMENGCEVTMDGEVQLFEKKLEAINDTISIAMGYNTADTSVWFNDSYVASIDINTGNDKNIYYRLLNCDETYDPTELEKWESDKVQETKYTKYKKGDEYLELNKIDINAEGKLVITKLPTFYGIDSIDYVVYNTEYLESGRESRGRIYFFAGNVSQGDDDILIPNAFSPNGDGLNDEFVISQFKGEPIESTLEVFNRWGSIVYRSDGKRYGKDTPWWDGKSNAGMVSLGEELPSGTYFYVFKVDVSDDKGATVSKEYSGFIELRR